MEERKEISVQTNSLNLKTFLISYPHLLNPDPTPLPEFGNLWGNIYASHRIKYNKRREIPILKIASTEKILTFQLFSV